MKLLVLSIALVVAACGGGAGSSSAATKSPASIAPASSSEAASSAITGACLEAVQAAAAIGDNADTVTDLDPAIKACGSLEEFAAAAAANPAALDGVDAAEFVGNRCLYEPGLANSAICKEVAGQ